MLRNLPRITLTILLSSCFLALILSVTNVFNDNNESLVGRRLSEEALTELNEGGNIGFLYPKKDGDKLRPRIHTFFNYIEDEKLKTDYNLLDIWKKAWYLAGFYPVVLTVSVPY